MDVTKTFDICCGGKKRGDYIYISIYISIYSLVIRRET